MPKDAHARLVQAALDAVTEVFTDRSVAPGRTKASMLTIQVSVEGNLDALEDVDVDEDDDES